MLLDLENLFSDSQEIKDTCYSTNTIKMGGKGTFKEVSFGVSLPLIIQVIDAFNGLTSLKVAVETASDENFSNAKTLVETQAVLTSELKAGYRFPINYIPKGNLGYMRLKYIPVVEENSEISAGKITAGIVAGHDNSYQDT